MSVVGLLISLYRLICLQGNFVACMTAILRQMEDYHYAHLIKTFGKMRTDVVVSVTLTFYNCVLRPAF